MRMARLGVRLIKPDFFGGGGNVIGFELRKNSKNIKHDIIGPLLSAYHCIREDKETRIMGREEHSFSFELLPEDSNKIFQHNFVCAPYTVDSKPKLVNTVDNKDADCAIFNFSRNDGAGIILAQYKQHK